jgi:hypothetical protein
MPRPQHLLVWIFCYQDVAFLFVRTKKLRYLKLIIAVKKTGYKWKTAVGQRSLCCTDSSFKYYIYVNINVVQINEIVEHSESVCFMGVL